MRRGVDRTISAYVSRGLGGGGGTVNGTWLEAHASVTLKKLIHLYGEIKMIVVLLVNAGVPIMGIVVAGTPTVAAL